MPKNITIYEVGPRDGLQYEKLVLPPEQIAVFINLLSQTGLTAIECGSFVSPKKVPQMANTAAVMRLIQRKSGIRYSVLVPNQQGMQAALLAKPTEIAIFTAASDAFLEKNIGCSIEESYERFKPVVALAKAQAIQVRGYISCALGCPYTGSISVQQVAEVAYNLNQLGCDEICIADTIGRGKPDEVPALVEAVAKVISLKQLAVHFHDTLERLAIPKVLAAVACGIQTVDSAVGNLGGCPYAPGASGNVATETVIEALTNAGYESGINPPALLKARDYLFQILGRAAGT